MVRARRVSRRGPDAAVGLSDQVLVGELLLWRIRPELPARALVHVLRERLGQPVGERLEHDCAVVVVRFLESLDMLVDADAGGDGERADVVARPCGRHEVGETGLRLAFSLGALLAQVYEAMQEVAAILARVHRDVVVIQRIGREETEHGACLQPALVDDSIEHLLRILVQRRRRFSHGRVVEDLRKLAVKLPGVEERHPVDVIPQDLETDVVKHASTRECGDRRLVGRPVDLVLAAARLRQRQLRRQALLVRMLVAAPCVVLTSLVDQCVASAGLDQSLRDAYGTRCILHINNRALVFRLNLHRGVCRRGRCTADQQWQRIIESLHFTGHVAHFFKGWCY